MQNSDVLSLFNVSTRAQEFDLNLDLVKGLADACLSDECYLDLVLSLVLERESL